VQGNCNTVDHTGSQWCYVSLTGPLATSCQDIQPSSRFPGHGWSYEACATPDLLQCASGAIPPAFPPAPLSPPSHVHPIVPQPSVVGAGVPQPAIAGAPVNVPHPSQQPIVGSAVPQPALVGPAVPQPTLVGQSPISGPPLNGPAFQQTAVAASVVPQPGLAGPAINGPYPAQPLAPGPQVPFPSANQAGGVFPDNVRTGLKESKDDSVRF